MKTEKQILTLEKFKDPVLFTVGYCGKEPHDKQIEVLKSKAKHRMLCCGRRSGKTELLAYILIRNAALGLCKKQIVICPVAKQSRIVFDKILAILRQAKQYRDLKKVVQSPYPRLTWLNDCYIDFSSADNYDSLRGENYDFVAIDEAPFIKENAWNSIRPLIYDVGADMIESGTPFGKGSFFERWQLGQSGNSEIECFHYNYSDNPHITEDGIKEIEKDIKDFGETSMFVQCEILGNFVEDRDVYFSRDLILNSINEEIVIGERHPKATYYLGIDASRFGRDKTVLTVIEDKDGEYKVVEIVETEKQSLMETVGRARIMDVKYDFEKIHIDETGVGGGIVDALVEVFDSSKIVGLTFTMQMKMDLFSNLKKLFEQGKLKIPNHRKLIFELCDIRYTITSNKQLKIHHPERHNAHDDFVDSLCCAVWAFQGDSGQYVPMIG